MKVLILGATGNVGLRLVPALIAHGHTVVAYVRSSSKLESLLPKTILEQVMVVQGDATDSSSIKKAILETKSDAIINTAGNAAVAPWSKSDFPIIFQAVVSAVVDAGQERGAPLRAWFLGGMGLLRYPGTDKPLTSYENLQLLKSLPSSAINWSVLCPSYMAPESPEISVSFKSAHGKLIANAVTPPRWNQSWVESVPAVGKFLSVLLNAGRYGTTLEQNADLIATDLETRSTQWIGTTVGVISDGK